jgi:hypothetical protein
VIGGMGPKRKGYEFERECVNDAKGRGLVCRRVPLSGAGEEKGDIVVHARSGLLRGELKRRKNLPQWIVDALGDHDFMAMRGDRGKTLAVIPWSTFMDLIQ